MAIQGTNPGPVAGPEVLVELRVEAGHLRAQVEQGLRDAIRLGRLDPGARLPSSRVLAADLGVSRRLVSDAYEQLLAEGWLETRAGAGTWVAAEAVRVAAGHQPDVMVKTARPRPRFDFFSGSPDLSGFPRAEWTRALRDTVREAPDADLGYGDPRGPEVLRIELAAYLRRARGLTVDPDAMVVCSGTMQALSLLARVLVRAGRTQIAAEDPTLGLLTASLAHAGGTLIPVPVDHDGINTDALKATTAEAVLVTPAHQFPRAVSLAAERRGALIEWAASGRLVIEDDYNAEFRFDRPAVGALQALAPDCVAHVGTVSKALAPALRLGWLIPPASLVGDVLEARYYADGGPAAIECLALARMFASGAYDRHLRAARRRYRTRREALAAAVARELPHCEITGADGGLFAPVRLATPVDAATLANACLARDTAVYPLSWFSAQPSTNCDSVVLGYGNLSEPAIAEGVRRLADALQEID